MKTTGHQAIVTGGGSGIGLAIARALLAAGNQVTLIGRDPIRLAAAVTAHPGLKFLAADVAAPAGRAALLEHVERQLGDLSILVNSAGLMRPISLRLAGAAELLNEEIMTNLVAPMQLSTRLLPRLSARKAAAIINVTTALIYVPAAALPAYSASKSGLHAFTRALRWQVKDTNVRVIELIPPPVETAMSKNFPGAKLQPEDVAQALMRGIEHDVAEIAIGQAGRLQSFARWAPGLAFKAVNSMTDQVAGRATP